MRVDDVRVGYQSISYNVWHCDQGATRMGGGKMGEKHAHQGGARVNKNDIEGIVEYPR